MREQDLGLTSISEPEDDFVADLVFVHGLDGHRSRSWTNKMNEFWPPWISDSRFIPGARVWTYGYNAKSILGSQDDLKLHGVTLLKALVDGSVGRKLSADRRVVEKPVVFIAHSLGGIVVKMAMLLSHEPNKSWSYIFKNTAAIAFLGTPHRGSRWASMMLGLAVTTLLLPPSKFLHLLRMKSSLLSTLAERFNNIWGDRSILTFRETTGVLGAGMIVRPKDACTNCQHEQVHDIANSNHIDISKPDSISSPLFQVLVTQVKIFIATPLRSFSTTAAVPPDLGIQFSKRPFPSKAIRCEFTTTETPRKGRCNSSWHEISEERLGDAWAGGSYWATFVADASGSTIIYAEIDPAGSVSEHTLISWTISAPRSLWYPGKFSGTIRIDKDYPFSQPWVRFSTAIFSPKVSAGGRFSSAFDLGEWSPVYTILDVLHSVAAMIMLDPYCRSHMHPLLPVPLDHHDMCYHQLTLLGPDSDIFVQAANFFTRTYAQSAMARMSNPVVTKYEVDASIKAIQEVLQLFKGSRCLENAPFGSSSNDPVQAFAGIRETEQWVVEERRWADAISLSCGLGFVQD